MPLERRGATKKEVVKDFRTGEIADAARRVISELGYPDASMERIAQEAGVSKGTLYLYFRNKRALLLTAIEHSFGELMTDTRLRTERVEGCEAKLAELVRAWVEHTNEQRAFFRVLQMVGPEFSEEIRGLQEIHLSFVAELLEKGLRDRELRQLDPVPLARLLVNLLRGTSLARLNESDPPDGKQDVATIVDVLLHGIGAGDPS
ncbi:MAG: TetR/AcrR family transcriptional regulator [Myxococcota bacterium]|nr:TetR/AcrR family transcriptional regulator [Myxococcota bacterium]